MPDEVIEGLEAETPETTVPAEGAQPAAPAKEPPPPIENQMLDGIKAALKPVDPEAAKQAAEQKRVDDALAEANKGKTPEEIAAAKAATDAETKKKTDAEEE